MGEPASTVVGPAVWPTPFTMRSACARHMPITPELRGGTGRNPASSVGPATPGGNFSLRARQHASAEGRNAVRSEHLQLAHLLVQRRETLIEDQPKHSRSPSPPTRGGSPPPLMTIRLAGFERFVGGRTSLRPHRSLGRVASYGPNSAILSQTCKISGPSKKPRPECEDGDR
jgi:hypothetical protein